MFSSKFAFRRNQSDMKRFLKYFFDIPLTRIPLIVIVALIISGLFYFYGENFDFLSAFQYLLYTFMYWQGNYAYSCYIHEHYPDIDIPGSRYK